MLKKLPLILIPALMASCSGKQESAETVAQNASDTSAAAAPAVNSPNPEAIKLNEQAAELIKNNQPDSALVLLDKALALQPDLFTAHGNKIKIYSKKKDFTKALEVCNALLQLKPDLAETWMYAGMLSEKLGKPDEAMSNYKKSMELLDQRIADPAQEQNKTGNKYNKTYLMMLMGQEQEAKAEALKLKEEGMDAKTVDNFQKSNKASIFKSTFPE